MHVVEQLGIVLARGLANAHDVGRGGDTAGAKVTCHQHLRLRLSAGAHNNAAHGLRHTRRGHDGGVTLTRHTSGDILDRLAVLKDECGLSLVGHHGHSHGSGSNTILDLGEMNMLAEFLKKLK